MVRVIQAPVCITAAPTSPLSDSHPTSPGGFGGVRLATDSVCIADFLRPGVGNNSMTFADHPILIPEKNRLA